MWLSQGVSSVVQSIGEAFDRNFTTEEERAKAANAWAEIEASVALRELDRQIAEAGHPSVFVAGARPFQIWASTGLTIFALAGVPLINLAVGIAGEVAGADLPTIPLEAMMGSVASGGLGAWQYRERRREKEKGVARDNLKPRLGRQGARPFS